MERADRGRPSSENEQNFFISHKNKKKGEGVFANLTYLSTLGGESAVRRCLPETREKLGRKEETSEVVKIQAPSSTFRGSGSPGAVVWEVDCGRKEKMT